MLAGRNMKRIILAAAIAFSSGTALAGSLPAKFYLTEMPTQYRGLWCDIGSALMTRSNSCTGSSMRITAKGYETEALRCDANKIIVNPKTHGHSVKFRCAWKDKLEPGADIYADPDNGDFVTLEMHLVGSKLWANSNEIQQ
jgi:hypothetical protein